MTGRRFFGSVGFFLMMVVVGDGVCVCIAEKEGSLVVVVGVFFGKENSSRIGPTRQSYRHCSFVSRQSCKHWISDGLVSSDWIERRTSGCWGKEPHENRVLSVIPVKAVIAHPLNNVLYRAYMVSFRKDKNNFSIFFIRMRRLPLLRGMYDPALFTATENRAIQQWIVRSREFLMAQSFEPSRFKLAVLPSMTLYLFDVLPLLKAAFAVLFF